MANTDDQTVDGRIIEFERLGEQTYYDPELIVRRLLDLLKGLETRLHRGPAAEVIGEVILERVRKSFATAAARPAGQFQVSVIGEFKRGKSTLINALLGQEVAATDVLPQTCAVTRYSWGKEARAQLRLADGGVIPLELGQLRRETLEPILERSPAAVLGAEVTLPWPELRDLCLVDTPGTGDLRPDVRKVMCEHIADSDLLIMVISAIQPLSEEERDLLRSAIRPHDFPKLMFVLNRIDTLEDQSEIDKLHHHVRDLVGDVFPGMNVYPLSALDEARRRAGRPRPRPDRSDYWAAQFAAFRQELDSIVAAQRLSIKADRLAMACDRAMADIEARLQLLLNSLDDGQARLAQSQAERVARVEAEAEGFTASREVLAARIAELGAAAEGWMQAFARRLVTLLPPQLRGLTAGQIERDLQFFVAASAESGLQACLDAHAADLASLAQEMIGDTAKLDLDLQDAGALAARAVYSGPQWSVGALVRRTLDQTIGMGMVFDIGAGLFGALAGRAGDGRIGERLSASADELAARFGEAARAAYARIGQQLVEHLSAVQQVAGEATRESVAQAERLHRGKTKDLAAARTALEAALSWLAEARAEALRLKAQSSPGAAPQGV